MRFQVFATRYFRRVAKVAK